IAIPGQRNVDRHRGQGQNRLQQDRPGRGGDPFQKLPSAAKTRPQGPHEDPRSPHDRSAILDPVVSYRGVRPPGAERTKSPESLNSDSLELVRWSKEGVIGMEVPLLV